MKMKIEKIIVDNEHQDNIENDDAAAADEKPIERNETLLDNTEA